jgi:hypothetical protein
VASGPPLSVLGGIYEGLKRRRGGRRAIVAVARRLLGVLVAWLRSSQDYREPARVVT